MCVRGGSSNEPTSSRCTSRQWRPDLEAALVLRVAEGRCLRTRAGLAGWHLRVVVTTLLPERSTPATAFEAIRLDASKLGQRKGSQRMRRCDLSKQTRLRMAL